MNTRVAKAHPPTHISRRAYAKRRGVTEGAIRQAITSGKLREAVTADNKIDVAIADRLLAERTTAGVAVSGDLEEARRRKTAASVALLQSSIADLAATVAPVAEMRAAHRHMAEHVGEVMRRHVLAVADEVAGAEPAAAFAMVYDGVCAGLTEVSSTDVVAEPPADAPAEEPTGARRLETLSHVELRTLKADLETKRLQILRDLKSGRVARIADVMPRIGRQMAGCRTNLLALASKVAPLMLIATPAAARKTLADQLDQALEALNLEPNFHAD